MAELADALDSGSNERKLMEVQVLLSAPRRSKLCIACSDFSLKKQSALACCSSFPQKASLAAADAGTA